MKILNKLLILLYGGAGIMNIIMGMFYSKNFYQSMTGLLFIVLLINQITICRLQEIIKIKEKKFMIYT